MVFRAKGPYRFSNFFMNVQDIDTLQSLLCDLGLRIRDAIDKNRTTSEASFNEIACLTNADTIYHIDKLSEDAIFSWFEENWPKEMPIELVMEGIEDDELVTFPRDTAIERTRYKLIIDPIDGTRNLMYDKRAGWSLAGIAPQLGPETNLEDIVVAVMTELPTSRQGVATQLWATRHGGHGKISAVSDDLRSGERREIALRSSPAKDLRHGFASVAKYFPAAKSLLAQFEEELFQELMGAREMEQAIVFDDQYISTGGQLYELIAGHDRFVLDIRPMAFQKLNLQGALACHPYDLCSALVARESGVIVEAPNGGPLSIPLDTTTPVSWVGYANPVIANAVRPILSRLIDKYFS